MNLVKCSNCKGWGVVGKKDCCVCAGDGKVSEMYYKILKGKELKQNEPVRETHEGSE